MRLLALTNTQWEDYRPYVDTALLACGDLDVSVDAEPLGGNFAIASALADRLEQELPGRILLFPPIPLFQSPALAMDYGEPSTEGRENDALFVHVVQAFVQARHREGFQHVIIVVPSIALFETLTRGLTDEVREGFVALWHWHNHAEQSEAERRIANRNMATFLIAARRKAKTNSLHATAEEGKATIRVYFQQLLVTTHRLWGVES